jgi:hypothetical protein
MFDCHPLGQLKIFQPRPRDTYTWFCCTPSGVEINEGDADDRRSTAWDETYFVPALDHVERPRRLQRFERGTDRTLTGYQVAANFGREKGRVDVSGSEKAGL